MAPPVHTGRVTFGADDGFHAELKRRVRVELAASGRPVLGSFRMYLKTVTILMWLAASYALLVFAHVNWWQASLLAVSLALAVGATGFAIQHDANHGAYSATRSSTA